MGCRILLVEAETISRRKITELLISEGYSVEEADTGSAALHLLESSNFDVVVSDLRLLGRITGADVVDFAALRNHGVITIGGPHQ